MPPCCPSKRLSGDSANGHRSGTNPKLPLQHEFRASGWEDNRTGKCPPILAAARVAAAKQTRVGFILPAVAAVTRIATLGIRLFLHRGAQKSRNGPYFLKLGAARAHVGCAKTLRHAIPPPSKNPRSDRLRRCNRA